jgi:hypothetical protein
LSTAHFSNSSGRNALRHSLDNQMRALLAQLELISAIPAANYDTGHGTDDDPLGRRPPGDYGYRTFAEMYGPPFAEPSNGCAVTNAEREDVIEHARRELAHLRKTAQRDPDTFETPDQTRKSLLAETAGWSLQDIATSHWKLSTTIVRRMRIADGRDAESGLYVELTDEGLDLASRAREMKGAGMSVRAIGMALGGIHSYQVQRLLKRVA